MRPRDLESWLRWQESLHPRDIELGLERLRPVYSRLPGLAVTSRVISVAGTNGKGTCVAVIEAVAIASGLRVATYTSPHLYRYNERIRIDGQPVDDDRLVGAFEAVERARRGTPLTYFEFGTLAALEIFAAESPDLVVLEVGMGGRLDAVNIVDADVAVITSIGLDHQAWLGFDRESIANEKAGILRSKRAVVIGDPDPPETLLSRAGALGAPVYSYQEQWWIEPHADVWHLSGVVGGIDSLPYGSLRGVLIRNAGCALQALALIDSDMLASEAGVRRAIHQLELPGRMQIVPGDVEWIVDLAHNPEGAGALAAILASRTSAGTSRAVFGMLADKDIGGVVKELASVVDEWFLSGIQDGRGASVDEVAAQVAAAGGRRIEACDTVEQACRRAASASTVGDRVIAFGSFHIVGPALEWLAVYSPASGRGGDQPG
ncbi:MAG: bifunctional tetrahydrofolate synthase/dihydrofolate synthase [Gammaproteobacteria bacterium]|nr:MAG: bifunctional tetrahydrofolate synthase/dihydrofolate synthase [Gammaproteobacteria bacterium]